MATGAINEAAGWILILLGFLTGAGLGLGFDKDQFLGGYGSFKRRMLRLGHIALVALGMINIVFGLSVSHLGLGEVWVMVAAAAWIVGGVAMPTCCALAAFDQRKTILFPLPVVALVTACTITAAGALMGVWS